MVFVYGCDPSMILIAKLCKGSKNQQKKDFIICIIYAEQCHYEDNFENGVLITGIFKFLSIVLRLGCRQNVQVSHPQF